MYEIKEKLSPVEWSLIVIEMLLTHAATTSDNSPMILIKGTKKAYEATESTSISQNGKKVEQFIAGTEKPGNRTL